MGGRIPHLIKLKVINDWLLGKSHDDTALNNGISNGSVSNIIKEVKNKDIIDHDLVRATAIHLKRIGLTIPDLASSINLRNMLDKLELPEERVERLLLALSIFNYKNDIEEPEKFIKEIEKISEYVFRLDASVFSIIEHVENNHNELQKLKSEILCAEMELERIINKNKKLILEFEKFKNRIALEADNI